MGFSKADTDAMLARIREKSGRPSSILGEVVNVRAEAKGVAKERSMNKTERRYSLHLDDLIRKGAILRWDFEPEKFRLADNTFYTPDFRIITHSKHVEFADVKAWWVKAGRVGAEEDSLVKMKVVAEQHPMYGFKMTWEVDGNWQERVF